MPYNNLVSRANVQALIPEDVSNAVLQGAVAESAALSLFPRITLASNIQRLPVLSALPTAYFVSGDTGLKQTTEMAWANKFLNVEELAAIVPVPEAVLEDANFDIWGEVQPRLVEAIGRALDAAIFFGTNKPTSWPADIAAACVAASNAYTRGTATQAQGGLAEDFNQLQGLIENDGYSVTGFVTRTNYRTRIRSARDTTGQSLADFAGGVATISGQRVVYSMPGLWPSGAGAAEVFAGEWSRMMLGVRRDFTWKLLDQAVLTDAGGLVVYNLPQQDMLAMRVTFRMAWAVANPMNFENTDETTRYPVAVLRSP